ncbi:hypothetical protein NHP200010_12520 [Helicobacter bizzozeronii]|uniref:helix-turn-helix domain-containing transcriptional regulator n=1 Tax=Helicobacter bizzozeronii TaxID=56877 RepID=UPI00244D92F0|nr:hypothetical protein [Helicobacter bizzozeronii]GMB93530.1 hypothetical protein NHP200010_12520 [Helicobacter bizzozeronii]
MKVTLSLFDVVEFLDTDEMRLSYLNAVLEDGDTAELKRALVYVAKSKDIELPVFNGDVFEFTEALKKLGFGLQAWGLSKSHTA